MKYLFSLLLLIGQSGFSQVGKVDCGDKKLVISFLNGVLTETSGAKKSRENITGLVQNDPDNTRISPNGLDDICYKYIYNQTEGIYDFVETLAQKIRESDTSQSEEEVYKKVAQYWFGNKELLASLPGGTTKELQEAEIQRIKSTEYDTLHLDVGKVVKEDLKERSVLVVSHSQGNLFANLLYEQLELDTTLNYRLKNYANLQVGSAASHIAAIPESYGDYYTSKQDEVISSLDILGNTLPANVEMASQWLGNTQYFPFSSYDSFGHKFVEVYTNQDLQGSLEGDQNFRSMSSIFMDKLKKLADSIMEPRCSAHSNSPFNMCVKILEVPKNNEENLVFEVTTCNNPIEIQEDQDLFLENLKLYYSYSSNRYDVQSLVDYKIDGSVSRYSVPFEIYGQRSSATLNDNTARFNFNFYIHGLSYQFDGENGVNYSCADRLHLPVRFSGPDVYCKEEYYRDPDTDVVVTANTLISMDEERISVPTTEKNNGCDEDYKVCASTGFIGDPIICESSVKNSRIWKDVLYSNIDNSYTLSPVVNSTIKNSYPMVTVVNSTLNDTYLYYPGATCYYAYTQQPNNALIGKQVDGGYYLLDKHSFDNKCYSWYSMSEVERVVLSTGDVRYQATGERLDLDNFYYHFLYLE